MPCTDSDLSTTLDNAQSDILVVPQEDEPHVPSPSESVVLPSTSPVNSPTVVNSPVSAFSDIAPSDAPVSPTIRMV